MTRGSNRCEIGIRKIEALRELQETGEDGRQAHPNHQLLAPLHRKGLVQMHWIGNARLTKDKRVRWTITDAGKQFLSELDQVRAA